MNETSEEDRSGQSEVRRFEDEAGQPQTGFAAELWEFLLHSKKWWLVPTLVVLLLLGILVVLAGTPAGPFLYTLF